MTGYHSFQSLAGLCVCRSNITQIEALALAHSASFPVLGQLVIDKKALGELTIDQYAEQIVFKDTLQSLVVISYEREFKHESITFN